MTGCSNTRLTKEYLRWVMRRRMYDGERVMLTWDAFKGQTNDEVQDHIKKYYPLLDIVDIPACMTKYLQPLDLTVNKIFKQLYDDQYDEWFKNGQKFYTPSGYRQKPSYQLIMDFVVRAWEKVPADTVKLGFLQAGISNSMDGEEDNLVKF